MKSSRGALVSLFVSTALGTVFAAENASAQASRQAAQQAEQAQAANSGAADAALLGDVVVTATRQSDTVSRVPLSVTAQTQQTLDRQGFTSPADLQRSVPALTVTGQQAGVQTFNIRGIVQSGAVQATTGVYLDDIPLQKRATTGVSQNNGSPAPPLFDLERVEVLRGPQGTLYGGSSEGGTVRFIEPTPSLTHYSGQVQAQVSGTQYGNPSFIGGVAIGGPIVQDKLAFRLTVYDHHTGGYIDEINPYTGADQCPNCNDSDTNAQRLVVLWAPSDNARVQFSYYQTWTRVADTTSGYLNPLSRQLTEPSLCYNVNPAVASTSSGNPPSIACPATAKAGQTINGVYEKPAYTYGPYNFGPFQNLLADPQKGSPNAKSLFNAPSLKLEYDFPRMTATSITTYIHDAERSNSFDASPVSGSSGVTDKSGNYFAPGAVTTSANVAVGTSYLPDFQDALGVFRSHQNRWGLIQEFRFASAGDAKPLSWVGGLYFSDIRAHSNYQNIEYTDPTASILFGAPGPYPSAYRYTQLVPGTCGTAATDPTQFGLPGNVPRVQSGANCLLGLPLQPGADVANRDQRESDVEVAGYGEVNYWATDKFKLTAGIRWSRVSFNYTQVVAGNVSGFLIPTVANTGITNGSTTESPITPHFGAQYQLTDNDMVYVSVAKGYREGGVNVPLPAAICGPGLANVGLTVADAPATFNSDTVWSYEGGTKLRVLNNRVQLTGSLYRIDWSQIQLNVTVPGCGPTFIQNAGTARSQGFDGSIAARLFDGLTLNSAFGYDSAKYTQTAFGPAPRNGTPATAVVQAGDTLPVPRWQVSVGLQYDFGIAAYKAFVRGDYQFQSSYLNGAGPGVGSYAPDNYHLPSTTYVSVRAGVTVGHVDASVFVNNLFNSTDALSYSGGRTGGSITTGAACTTFTNFNPMFGESTFRPREVGVQANYRF